MPYIKQERRQTLDYIVEQLYVHLKFDGDLNYVLFALCKELEPSYHIYKNYLGELDECAAEIRRRLLAPYEDQKIIENGDVD